MLFPNNIPVDLPIDVSQLTCNETLFSAIYPSSYPIQEETIQQPLVQEYILYQQTHPEPATEVTHSEPTVKGKGAKAVVPTELIHFD